MDQEQAHDSRSALLQRWLDVLHRWEEKRSQYQIELDKTTDVAQQEELRQGIESCEQVIQTSQGLIQALSDRYPQSSVSGIEPPTESWLLPSVSTSTPAPSSELPVSPPAAFPGLALPAPASLIEAQTLRPASEEAATATNSLSIQPWQMPPPVTAHPPSMAKRLLKIGLPLLILVAGGLAIFRPKNVCKLAPNGAYNSAGLALWVEQALAESEYAESARTVSIAQFGCTIILKGTVPSVEVKHNVGALAEGVKLPSQAPLDQIKRALGMDAAEVWPVKGVVSELKVERAPDIEP
ncbi:hypothetical protein C1752_00761 [Acaryochloris thomasi RCC1774]|uniref:BON domain-containing protein n=1 Tax=Acaryochloris thomasi RCC1774 TaxID=1764569 RepID=A0A2W1JN71_9CYAN|nr:hypothetical protein [Acaryochloris thomasi]PZD74666.1 hypothetical protein C1752_00761 [Acaryochloris thomasi RCC1774]